MSFILAQVMYAMGVLCYISAQFQKKKIWFTLVCGITNVFFALNYVFLDRFGTSIFLLFEIVVLFSLYFFEKYNLKNKWTIILCAVIISLDIIALALTWKDALTLIPFSSTCAFLVSLMFKNVLASKFTMCYCILCSTVYLLLLHSYFSAILQLCLIVFVISGIIVSVKDNKAKKIIQSHRENPKTVLKNDAIKNVAHDEKEQTFSAEK